MRGRGIDFAHRFRPSRWAEDLLIGSLGPNHGLLTVRFGLSEIRSDAEIEYGTSDAKSPTFSSTNSPCSRTERTGSQRTRIRSE